MRNVLLKCFVVYIQQQMHERVNAGLVLLFGAANIRGDVCDVSDNNHNSGENQYSLCINGQVYMTLKFASDSNTQCTTTCTTKDPPTTSPGGPINPTIFCHNLGVAGTFKPADDDTCTKYIQCYLNSTIAGLLKTCNTGLYYDPNERICTPVKPKSCEPRDPNTLCNDMGATGFYKLDGDDTCRKYLYCYLSGSKLQGMPLTCPDDLFFDPNIQSCSAVKPNSCSPVTTTKPPTTSPGFPRDPITLCKDMATTGIFKPDVDDTCMKFIVCYIVNSEMQSLLKSCNTGEYFDPIERMCTSVKPNSCLSSKRPVGPRDPNTLCEDMGSAGSYKPDDDDTCKNFIVCYNTNSSIKGLLKTCPSLYYFDPVTASCTREKPNGCPP